MRDFKAYKDAIVVTGASGFIGSNIVRTLNEKGFTDIVVVDELGTDEKWKNLRGLNYREFIHKDDFIREIRDRGGVKPKSIIHMGACSATTERNADFLLRNNFEYTRDLCEWAVEWEARFITASSAATYGDGLLGYSDEDAVTPTLRPLNMYGYSKQMFDEWALRNGVYTKIVGLKFFNVFGPGEAHKGDMRSVVHKAYHEVLKTGAISLFRSGKPEYKDGEQKRDFVYVKDAVDVVLWFLDHPNANGLFNCGSGRAQTWLDLANAVFAAMKRAPKINWIDMPETLAGKYQYFTQADATKLKRSGYTREFMKLNDSVADYVKQLELEHD
ncbi:ADP-glyceromanno-heptose 6-epimerase [soil metagenome]